MFGVTKEKDFSIPSGANGSGVDPANLERPVKGVVIFCEDLTGIQAGTTLSVLAAKAGSSTPCQVYDPNTGAIWSITLPTSGTLWVVVPGAFGAQLVRLLLSQNASGASVNFKVFGADAGA